MFGYMSIKDQKQGGKNMNLSEEQKKTIVSAIIEYDLRQEQCHKGYINAICSLKYTDEECDKWYAERRERNIEQFIEKIKGVFI